MESSPIATSSSSSSDHYHHSSHWKRGRCIGQGSFATVHIATHNDHTFAVKSTPLSPNPTSTQLHSLNNEIQILKTLSCPHIIHYLGHDDTPTHRNLHLELLPNGTVSEQIIKTEHLVRSYTRCLLAALTHLHYRNIVHCDVKGRNVLVGNKYGECKLADFGSAFEIPSGDNGEVICPRGSPLWMAPEVLRGEYQGPESDVWSLGCTVIEMLTGKVKCGDTVWQIAFSDKTPEIPSNVSDKGRDFLNKCLRREWKERWSCEELMKHPFVAAEDIGFDPLTWSTPSIPSPRCVLDEFDSKFDGFEEMGTDFDSETTWLGLRSSSAVEKLCSGGGPVWEDKGWMTVRRGKMTEYSDSVMDSGGNERMGEVEGSNCNLRFLASSGLGLGSGVCGYELKDVFGGLLCRLSYISIMFLLVTCLFGNNYWRILERLFINGNLSLVWLFPAFCKSTKYETRNLNLL